jgi:hypothetical protein
MGQRKVPMRPTRSRLSTERTDVITLRDVAKAAGVSVSTVSRVLDDRVAPSRTATAVRVREIAEQLGYRRNTFASNLRRGATATIGVLVPRLSDTVMALMFEAIDRAAGKDGYHAIVATSGDDPTAEWNAAQSLLERNVDGVVLATSRTDDLLPSHLRDNGIPHVLVLRTDGKSPSSISDWHRQPTNWHRDTLRHPAGVCRTGRQTRAVRDPLLITREPLCENELFAAIDIFGLDHEVMILESAAVFGSVLVEAVAMSLSEAQSCLFQLEVVTSVCICFPCQ